MPMTVEAAETVRSEVERRTLDRITALALQRWPDLTDGQRRGLVDHLFKGLREFGHVLPASCYDDQIYLAERNPDLQKFFLDVPTKAQVEAALLKQRKISSPVDRLVLTREVEQMNDPDERLRVTEGLDLEPVVPVVAKAASKDAKPAWQMNEAELAEAVHARHGRALMPSKVRELADKMVRDSMSTDTPYLRELKTKLALKPWHQIDMNTRTNAAREARDVLGKNLKELGLGPE